MPVESNNFSIKRDKFESMNDYFHQKYGRIMVAKYRTKGQVKFGRKFYDNKNETDFNGCPLKVSKVQKQIFLFSFSNKKNEGTLL